MALSFGSIALGFYVYIYIYIYILAGGAVLLEIAIDLAPLEGLVVALSALVGSGRLWPPAALSYWELQ